MTDHVMRLAVASMKISIRRELSRLEGERNIALVDAEHLSSCNASFDGKMDEPVAIKACDIETNSKS